MTDAQLERLIKVLTDIRDNVKVIKEDVDRIQKDADKIEYSTRTRG